MKFAVSKRIKHIDDVNKRNYWVLRQQWVATMKKDQIITQFIESEFLKKWKKKHIESKALPKKMFCAKLHNIFFKSLK